MSRRRGLTQAEIEAELERLRDISPGQSEAEDESGDELSDDGGEEDAEDESSCDEYAVENSDSSSSSSAESDSDLTANAHAPSASRSRTRTHGNERVEAEVDVSLDEESVDEPEPVEGIEYQPPARGRANTRGRGRGSVRGRASYRGRGSSVQSVQQNVVLEVRGRGTRARAPRGRGRPTSAASKTTRRQPDASQPQGDVADAGASGDEERPRRAPGRPPSPTGLAEVQPAVVLNVGGRADVGGEERAKDGTTWTRIAPGENAAGRRGQQNVITEVSGPTGHALRYTDKDDPSTCWRLFVSEPMLKLIKHCTEKEARCVTGDNSWSVTLEELDAFIAILYARGAYGSSTMSLNSLWNQKWGPSFFSQTMGRNRFKEIMKFLRFDDKQTRTRRKEIDKFCLVSEFWDRFIENCIACYKPSADITVDEQLYPSKCRCPFTQFMANKPDKYGIKYWMVTDARVRYVLNAFPYLGKDESRPQGQSVGESVTLRLIRPFLNKGRNVTTDNYFTNLSLAKELKKKKTSIVGTLNRSRREVPPSVQKSKDALHSSVIYKSGDITLTSYQGKTSKNVLILSSMHPSVSVDQASEKKKPETVLYYNETKCGVDSVDQMSRKYTVRSMTRRWPVHVFFNVLDLAMINAHTLFKLATGSKMSRHSFIRRIAASLAEPLRIRRSEAVRTPPPQGKVAAAHGRKQCKVGLCNKNRTKNKCTKCEKFMCGQCTATVCKTCQEE